MRAESLSFLFFTLAKKIVQAERLCNQASLRTSQIVSGEIEVENFSLSSAETFTALKRGFLTNFLIINLSSHLVNFFGRPFLALFSIRFSSLKRFYNILHCRMG